VTGYGPDLAAIHHADHGELAHAAAAVVTRELRRARLRSGLVVDLGCGSGILAGELLAAGYDVLGVDSSPAMIELARATAPDATFRCASFLDTDLPDCAAVTAIGEVFNYTLDPRVEASTLDTIAAAAGRALPPGGTFVFDLAAPGRLGRTGVRRVFHETAGGTLFMDAREDRATRTLTRHITVYARDGGPDTYRRTDEVHLLHLYEPEEVVRAVERAGFAVVVRRGYGRVRLGPGHHVYVATRVRASGP
jgi:SAM-dependent methyltransferase